MKERIMRKLTSSRFQVFVVGSVFYACGIMPTWAWLVVALAYVSLKTLENLAPVIVGK